MIVLDYSKKNHKQIIHACVAALKQGKSLAYPTDTSFGLAVDATNLKAVKKLYRVKGRNFNKPVHIIPPGITYAKKIAKWDRLPSRLAKKFWPGGVTLVLALKAKALGYNILSANTDFIGLRMPKNQIALDLAKHLKRPITATSANVSGNKDCYSASDIVAQFKNQKYKPDIIINAGKLAKRKPSTVVKIQDGQMQILRSGPVNQNQILKVLKQP